METKIGYKVVNRQMKSILLNMIKKNPFAINYEIGKWIEPRIPNTPLFVFSDLTSALHFALPSDKIFYTEYIPYHIPDSRTSSRLSATFLYRLDPQLLQEWWSGKKEEFSIETRSTPHGTAHASKLKLLEEIK